MLKFVVTQQIHCESKKQDTKFSWLELPQMLTDFQNSFTGWLSGKFATNSYLNIPPHLRYMATLPCEVLVSENWWQSEICIVNHKIA